MDNSLYMAVSQVEPETERDGEKQQNIQFRRRTTAPRKNTVFLSGVLLLSVAANMYLCYQRYTTPWELMAELPTRYAHLRPNVLTKIDYFDDFQSPDRTVQDAAWDAGDLNPWEGIVALDDGLAMKLDLPHSQRWPWDLGKGVYVTVAAHELHCLRALRESVNQNYGGVPLAEQAWSYEHMIHCLNVLRISIKCHADDEPMYMGHLHDNVNRSEPRPGLGQIRMCRNWNALLDWTRAHSACYLAVDKFNTSFPELERYKYCPDGARPWEKEE